VLIREVLSGRWKLLLLVSAVAIVVPPEAAGPFKLPYFLLCGLALIPLAQITAELVDRPDGLEQRPLRPGGVEHCRCREHQQSVGARNQHDLGWEEGIGS